MTSIVAVAGAASLLVLGGWSGEKGSGRIKEEVRTVGAFHGVDVGGGVKADIRVGPERKVTVIADDNLLPKIHTKVVDGILTLDHDNLDPTRPIRLVVVTPTLETIAASGGVEVKVRAAAMPKFRVDGSGGVEVDVQGLDVDALALDLSGGSKVKLAGKAKQAHLELSGGVKLSASDLVVTDAELDASGGVEAKLNVTGTLSGDASGGVNVKVTGRPKMKVETSGFSALVTE